LSLRTTTLPLRTITLLFRILTPCVRFIILTLSTIDLIIYIDELIHEDNILTLKVHNLIHDFNFLTVDVGNLIDADRDRPAFEKDNYRRSPRTPNVFGVRARLDDIEPGHESSGILASPIDAGAVDQENLIEAVAPGASLLLSKHDHRRAPPAPTPVGVVKGFDEVERGQELADVLALHADAAAVDQADLTEALRTRFDEVVAGHVADLVRAEGVEVERVGDRDLDGVVVVGHESISPRIKGRRQKDEGRSEC
jgi:hypothetical protein